MKKALGHLRRGDLFVLDGIKYSVDKKRAIEGGYVPCVNMDNKEIVMFQIDTKVDNLK